MPIIIRKYEKINLLVQITLICKIKIQLLKMFSGVSFLSPLPQLAELRKPLQKQHPFFCKKVWLTCPWFKQVKHRSWFFNIVFLTSISDMTECVSDQWTSLQKTQVLDLFSGWLYNADAEPKQSSDIKLSFLPIRSMLYSQFSLAITSNFITSRNSVRSHRSEIRLLQATSLSWCCKRFIIICASSDP